MRASLSSVHALQFCVSLQLFWVDLAPEIEYGISLQIHVFIRHIGQNTVFPPSSPYLGKFLSRLLLKSFKGWPTCPPSLGAEMSILQYQPLTQRKDCSIAEGLLYQHQILPAPTLYPQRSHETKPSLRSKLFEAATLSLSIWEAWGMEGFIP